MIDSVPPGLIFLLGAFLIPLIKPRALKQIYLLFLPLLALFSILQMEIGSTLTYKFLEYELIFIKVDALSLCVAYVFVIIAFLAMVYSLHIEDDWQHVAAFLYIGSSLGVVFAGDLFTIFFFWEIMAITSVCLILYSRNKESLDAGYRYILMHVLGGCCLLAGIIIHVSATGSITTIPLGDTWAFWLILFGFGLNAAFIPLHTWLPDSYPRATLTGSVFMCVYTTKTGVYVLARYFPGLDFLVYMGITMCVFGVAMALLQNNARKLLSYHIISQVGYMVVGIGIGTTLAINGSIAHLFNHIFYKALLFMCIGSVIYMVGRKKITELGGLARYMPITCICFIIASLSIAGAPGFNGYISKGMIVLAAIKEVNPILELLLILVTVGTFLSFVKLGYYTFFAENKEITAKESPWNMQLAMILTAFTCILIGVYPKLLYVILPYAEIALEYDAYTANKVVGTVQLFLFSGLVFMIANKYFAPKDVIILDFDYFYRMGGRMTAQSCGMLNNSRVAIQKGVRKIKVSVIKFALNPVMGPKIRPLGLGVGWATFLLFWFGLFYILTG